MSTCPFCEPGDDDLRTHEVYRSNNFRIVEDIAPLVPNHQLLIPNKHYLSIAATVEDRGPNEIDRILRHVAGEVGGEDDHELWTMFEHGSTETSEPDRYCCINHAHLHIVPLETRYLPDQLLADGFKCTSSSSHIGSLASYHTEEYLLHGSVNLFNVYQRETIPSQYFRRIIGESMQNPFWNWRDAVDFGWTSACALPRSSSRVQGEVADRAV